MTRTRLALLGVCVALVLTACAGDPVAPPPLTLPTSSSPTVSVSPQAETAEEFIRRWIAVDAFMQNTGDTSEYLAMQQGCETCQEFADLVSSAYAAGGKIRTDGWTLTKITEEQGGPARHSVTFTVKSHPTVYVPRRGAEPQRLDGGITDHIVVLTRVGASWKIRYLAQVAR